uniref:Uncharacterized protein n=1 Tax=Anguilla anguilla TaxID=7936 RepID=A0A0E9RHT4_ANGAN
MSPLTDPIITSPPPAGLKKNNLGPVYAPADLDSSDSRGD